MNRKRMLKIIALLFVLFLALELYMRLFGNYCEPDFDKKTKIIKRRKNTEGVYKTKHTSTGYFRINNEGWNSHRDYFLLEKAHNTEDIFRIAIVGHSNVEGLRVPVNKTLSSVLEQSLNQLGYKAEVYTFGFGGMHLAQALHVSRHVVNRYEPDILIIGTLLDDFWFGATDKNNFLNLGLQNNNIIEKIPKRRSYEDDSFFSFLHFSVVLKYADIRSGIGNRIYKYFNAPDTVERNTFSVRKKREGIQYILKEFTTLQDYIAGKNLSIFFVKFPVVFPSHNYDYTKVFHVSYQKVMDTVVEEIEKYRFEVINLEDKFMEDYTRSNKKFDFVNDHHLNVHAHKIAGLAISDYLRNFLKEECNKTKSD